MITFVSRLLLLIIISSALSLLGGCVHTKYHTPPVSIPQTWQQQKQAATGTAVANQENWWQAFNDPLLDSLIDRALRTNNDLAAATIKVRRAQLQSGLISTNLTPTVNVSGQSNFEKNLKNGNTSQLHSVIGELSYEVDLWGRLASLRAADRWEALATEADRQNTALSLIGTVASAYWQVAYLNQRIALNKESIDYTKKVLALVQVRYRAGEVAKLDVLQAQQNVATQERYLTQLQQQLVEARNALAILFNQAPENPALERKTLPSGKLPSIAPGMPASLLSKRPDVHAAELRLHKYLANVDATKASFYPTFSLTGNLGSASTSLSDVLQNPAGTLGAGLTLPFVQWNTTRLTIKISQTEYEEAVVNFRQTLYAALKDVENALSANTQYQIEGKQLERIFMLAKKSEQLYKVKYLAGEVDIQFWLNAQEDARTAEISVLENRLNRMKNLMTLYQALGGSEGDEGVTS